jgi:exoribonuclease-2
VIKLLGRGEYVLENVGDAPIGHFGLALRDYTHSTAPNRRFPDLITQRQYKAFLNNQKGPYSLDELRQLASHCTHQEDAAAKVERQINKSAAAMRLSTQIGTVFDGIVTGSGENGTWVRIVFPPVEGKIIHGFGKPDVGDRVTVQLISVNISKGFIDFALHSRK